MKERAFRALVGLTLATGTGILGVMAACSSSSGTPAASDNTDNGGSGSAASSGSTGTSGPDATVDTDAATGPSSPQGAENDATLVTYDGPPPNVDGGQIVCATPDAIPIKYNPMYSGFDGTHMYQIPAFASGVDPGSVTWGSSDPTMVDFQPYVTGIMITTKKAGDVTIVARSGTMCGSAVLHIAQYTVDEWNIGNARYNNSMPLMLNPEAGTFDASGFDASGFDASDVDAAAICKMLTGMNYASPFGNTTPACTNCHGAESNGKLFGMSIFKDIAHTPEQTGGFSEDDLTNVFVNGVIPDGGTFDPSIVPYCIWNFAHKWTDIDTPEKQAGMRAYLRSLTPQEQTGCFELFSTKKCADGGT
jgi:hypothetical protein